MSDHVPAPSRVALIAVAGLALLSAGAAVSAADAKYEFLPNGHTVWAINHENGRFAGYRYLSSGMARGATERQIERSRVVTLNRRAFPADETVWLLSDRSRTDVIWTCNTRTGDVQLWNHRMGGEVDGEKPIRTLLELLPPGAADSEGASAQLRPGTFQFLPNRRSIWVVNRPAGRFAGYHFRDDQDRSVLRTRVVEVDATLFPAADVVYLLSDKNFAETMWVANTRTGVFQLWTPRAAGAVEGKTIRRVEQDLGGGTYRFLANRRTIWVANPDKGRLVAYRYRDNLDGTIEKSRVVDLDPRTFPADETDFLLGDLYLTESLWVVNTRTGRLQLWSHGQGGVLESEDPVETLGDLVPGGDAESQQVGDFAFLPYWRTVWVVHQPTGRLAGYHFKSDREKTIERTRVVALDQRGFPPTVTAFGLSDKNFAQSLWIGNTALGDFQLWTPGSGGDVRGDRPVSAMIDLMDRTSRPTKAAER